MTPLSHCRLDILTPIHKGLRLVMFDAAAKVGRADFTDDGDRTSTEHAVAACLALLGEHALNEDRYLSPLLAHVAPPLADIMAVEHPRLEQAARDLSRLWPRFKAVDDDARVQLGVELAQRLDLLVAQHLRHMTWEEQEVNAALWAGVNDAELAAIVARVAADTGPAHMREWNQIVFAAANPQEREGRESHLG